MIYGFKIEVSSMEVEELLRARSAAYQKRGEELGRKLSNLHSSEEEIRDLLGPHTRVHAMHPREVVEAKVKEVTQVAEYLTFLADHVVKGDHYQLTRQEAVELFGLLPTNYLIGAVPQPVFEPV